MIHQPAPTHPWTPWLLLAGCLIFLAGISLPITDGDTALYGKIAKNILASGDWVILQYREGWVVDKPPLTLWLIGASFAAFGVSEAALRAWHILLALATVAATYALARLILPPPKAGLSALVLLTSIQFFYQSLVPQQDIPLTLFVTLAFYWYLRWERQGSHLAAILLWASTALAVLAKGIIGLAISVMVLGLHLLLDRPPLPRKALASTAIGILIFFVIAAPWFIVGAIRGGWTFLDTFFLGGTLGVGRFFRPVLTASVKTPWWIGLGAYVPLLLVGILPWTGWLWPALKEGWRGRRGGSMELWLCTLWAVAVFGFLSLSPGDKVIRYLLPIFPPLAVLLGNVVGEPRWRRQAAGVSLGIAILGTTIFFWVFLRGLPGEVGRFLPLLFPFLPVFLASLFGYALASLRGCARTGILLLITIALLSYGLLIVTVNRSWDNISPWRPARESIRTLPGSETPILILGPHTPFADYYFDRPVEFVERDTLRKAWAERAVIAMVPADALRVLPAHPKPAMIVRLPGDQVLVRNFP